MNGVIEFFVQGRPATGGSKAYMGKNGKGRAIIAPASKYTKPWRDSVTWEAMQKANRMIPWDGPLAVLLTFYFHRPKGNFGTGKNANKLKPSAPLYPATSQFDLDKLARSTLDAMTGIIYKDDGQICDLMCLKRFIEPKTVQYIGCFIRITKKEATNGKTKTKRRRTS